MKSIFVIILTIILSSNSLSIDPKLSKNPKPKFCINCKHFMPDTTFSSEDNSNKFGRCSLFKNIMYEKYYLVNSKIEDTYDNYQYCSTIRNDDNKCGVNGKLYKKKYVIKNKY